MSRKPPQSTAGRQGISRTASASTLTNMPPPSKIPNRPTSAMSTSSTSSKLPNGAEPPSRSHSPTRDTVPKKPRRTLANGQVQSSGSRPRTTSGDKGGLGADDSGEMNIQVVVRCRGRSAMEVAQRTPIIITSEGAVSQSVTIETGGSGVASSNAALGLPVVSMPYTERAPVSKTYSFDKVFGPEADQTLVYKEAAEGMLDEVIQGYNCTIFAYGQTGTGKTYTMQGDLALTPLGTPVQDAGIVPRVMHRLFSLLESTPNAEFSVKCSYIELYNEELRDLLVQDFNQPVSLGGSAAGPPGGLKIYEDPNKKGANIQGLEEINIRTASEGLQLLHKGSQRRQVASTNMNAESSRSHSIFMLTVHIKETSLTGGEDLLKVGKLNLVDLAGSEAIGRSGAENKRAREAGMINQSLLTLGRVISALVEKSSHIPYRESKLTRLLQDSLGGRTKTCIIATVSPTRSNMEETLSTLDYAIRAKTIRNKPEINQRMTKGSLIKEYVSEIVRLKAQIGAAYDKNGVYLPTDQYQEMISDQEERTAQLADAKQKAEAVELKHVTLTAEFEQNMNMLLAREEDLKVARQEALQLQIALNEMNEQLVVIARQFQEEKYVSESYMRGEQRLNEIAVNLKATVNESVKDVGGLFQKIARKSDVLNANTGAASAYGIKLNGLADQLQEDIEAFKSVHTDFGSMLNAELVSFAARNAESLEKDKAYLEAQLGSFGQAIQRSKSEFEAQHNTALGLNSEVAQAQTELQQNLIAWMDEQRQMVEKVITNVESVQRTHLVEVDNAIEHISQTMDVLVTGTLDHTSEQLQSVARMQKLADNATEREVERLRNQNQQLAELLNSEKKNSARLREDLVAQISTLLLNFTLAQSQSLDTAISPVLQQNATGLENLGAFKQDYNALAEGARQHVRQHEADLEVVRDANITAKQDGLKAVADVGAAVTHVLEVYQDENATGLKKGASTMMSSSEGIMQATRRGLEHHQSTSEAHRNTLDSLHSEASITMQGAGERLESAKNDIKSVSDTVLKAHASADPMFAQQASLAQSHLSDLRQSNAAFIANIQEDHATGSTPRKRAWNVPASWQKTAPRDALVQKYRQMHQENNDYVPSFRMATTRMERLGKDEDEEQTDGNSSTSPTSPSISNGPLSAGIAFPSSDGDRDMALTSPTESEHSIPPPLQLQSSGPLAPVQMHDNLPETSPSTIPVELAKPLPTTVDSNPPMANPNPPKMSRTKSALNRSTNRAPRGEDKENAGGDNTSIPQRRVRRNV
ncbi:hypothetical protein QFC21_000902 [Naganishia friedmannii]|uniref:Uncharacterized protein n=1 Tax=Naganishia friedmannii TaxID=89922 RepID=A0ACC2W8C2_9TREE|nr:hypothetical protein QFC21_000902 [Naganishia friedmannii]